MNKYAVVVKDDKAFSILADGFDSIEGWLHFYVIERGVEPRRVSKTLARRWWQREVTVDAYEDHPVMIHRIVAYFPDGEWKYVVELENNVGLEGKA